MPGFKLRNQVLLTESELETILGYYPHILRPQLKTLIFETQNEYLQLQNFLLTEREKTQTKLHTASQSLVKSTSASTQMLFSAVAQNIIHSVTTLEPHADAKDKQEANRLKETKKKEMVELREKIRIMIVESTHSQTRMNFYPSHSLLDNLTSLCCGHTKEAIAWYSLDIKIKLWKKIETNLGNLVQSESTSTNKQTAQINDINHRKPNAVSYTNGMHHGQLLAHRSKDSNDCKINYSNTY